MPDRVGLAVDDVNHLRAEAHRGDAVHARQDLIDVGDVGDGFGFGGQDGPLDGQADRDGSQAGPVVAARDQDGGEAVADVMLMGELAPVRLAFVGSEGEGATSHGWPGGRRRGGIPRGLAR